MRPRQNCFRCDAFTSSPSGICSVCRPQPHEDRLVKAYALIQPLVYPKDHDDVPLPCRTRPDLDFTADGVTRAHRKVCSGCPLKDWCLQQALENDFWGCWGGTSREERLELLEERAA